MAEKKKPTDKPKRRRRKKTDDETPAVSLSRLRANPRRGGRGR
jgi:hypothetical protein